MPLDTSLAEEILQIDYRDGVREQLNNANFLKSKVRKATGKARFKGKVGHIALHTGRNVGVGARKEGGTLPTSGRQIHSHAEYKCKSLYARIELTGQVMAASKNEAASFVDALDNEINGAVTDAGQDENRQLWRDGSSTLTGAISNAGTTIEVESCKYLQAGMLVSIRNGSDGTVKDNGGAFGTGTVVSSITDANTFVAGAAPAAALDADDIVIRLNAREEVSGDAWGDAYEIWGLQAIVSDANPGGGLTEKVGNIDRTGANAFWKANVLSNGAVLRDLTLELMQEMFDLCEIEAGSDSKEIPGVIMTNYAIKRRYAALIQPDRRYVEDETLDGGYRALRYNGVPLMAEKDAGLADTPQQLNCMYFVALKHLEFGILEDWDWMDKDGAVLCRVPNKDAYEATLRTYCYFGADRINCHGVIRDLKEVA